ncbi:MAG TPA: CoA-transferase [Anaerolineales bacterium]|nr:CoA-transferase [Anaerolineales bacterium]
MDVLERGQGPLIQAIDLEEFRAWNRQKNKSLVDKRMSEAEAVQRFIRNGMYIGTELYGTVRCPMSLVNEIIRQGVKDLSVAGQGVMELDLLLGAGLVSALDITYIGLEVYGISNCLRREVESGRVKTCVEWSNASIAWRFKAAAMGVPFLPVRSMLGTDTFHYSAAVVVDCPFTGEPICLLPALILDVGLIHVHRADKHGNAQIDGISGFAIEMARASKTLIVSAEQIVDTDEIRKHPDRTVIPYYLVDAVVEAPFGSHPGEMCYQYRRDEQQIREWVQASKESGTTQAYMDKYVHSVKDHAEYLQKIGQSRLEGLRMEVEND